MNKPVPCLLALLLAACSDGSSGPADAAPPPDSASVPDADPGVLAELACADTAESIYADPGTLPTGKGTIIRCTRDPDISQADLATALTQVGFPSPAPTSGAHVYRVLYVTERGTDPPTPGTSSAIVYLPDHPRAAKLPVMVASHGSRGQAGKCAPSLADPAADYVQDDFLAQVLPLVGAGYALIAPDLAGYANFGAAGNPPSAYGCAADVGPSTLDGARALRSLIPSSVMEDVVLVGHSQGGHTTLAALAMSATYGAGGPITAVAVHAPLWLSNRTWGAIPFVASMYPFDGQARANAVSIWYHYTRATISDGPDHALDMFKPEKHALLQSFVDNQCWSHEAWAALLDMGTSADDIFDPTWVAAVSEAAGLGSDCPTSPADAAATCAKWVERYVSDRPHLTGEAASVPILLTWGTEDTTMPFDRITCALDRLDEDGASYTLCVRQNEDHNSIVVSAGDYVSDWIAWKVLGGADPGTCGLDRTVILDSYGHTAVCAPVPPND